MVPFHFKAQNGEIGKLPLVTKLYVEESLKLKSQKSSWEVGGLTDAELCLPHSCCLLCIFIDHHHTSHLILSVIINSMVSNQFKTKMEKQEVSKNCTFMSTQLKLCLSEDITPRPIEMPILAKIV